MIRKKNRRGSHFFVFILVILVLSLSHLYATSFAQEWAKTFGGTGNDSASSVDLTEDDGFIVSGNTGVLRLDAGGNVLWQKRYSEQGFDIVRRDEGDGFIAASGTSVTKLDATGEVVWQKTYDSSGESTFHLASIHRLPRSSDAVAPGYIIGGTISGGSDTSAWSDILIAALGNDGNIEWQKTYDSGTWDTFISMEDAISDRGTIWNDGFIITGHTGSRNGDFWVLILDEDGNPVWKKAYGLQWGGNQSTEFYPHIARAADGGYLLAGISNPLGTNAFAWVLKLDSLGNVQWHKDYGIATSITDLKLTLDEGHIMAGTNTVDGDGYSWIAKLDEAGGVLWSNGYGNPQGALDDTFDKLSSIQQVSHVSYIVAGSTEFLGKGSKDMWVLKLDAIGKIEDCPSVFAGNRLGWDIDEPGSVVIDTPVTVTESGIIARDTTSSVTVENIDLYEGSGCDVIPETSLVRLPRTGQVASYYPGDDGDLQHGVSGPSTRFTDHGNGTITDNLTGLMWLKDANCARTLGLGTDSMGQLDWYATSDFVEGINDGTNDISTCASYSADHTDWRVPNIVEIESLVTYELANLIYVVEGENHIDQGEWLENQGFVNVESVTYLHPHYYPVYWSSTTMASDKGHAWSFVMSRGLFPAGGGNWKSSRARYIWPVRGGQLDHPDPAYPANLWKTGQTVSYGGEDIRDDGRLRRGVYWPSPRFSDQGDGTVIDNLTKLMWLKDANCFGERSWNGALDTVADFNVNPSIYDCADYDESNAPYDDWYLPNRKELFSLIDFSRYYPALPVAHPFINDAHTWRYGNYWTSTTYPGLDSYGNFTAQRAFHMRIGAGSMLQSTKGGGYFVWPVRIFDGDNDGISDKWERDHFGDLTTANATTDYDGDGLLDKDECRIGTDPRDTDTDSDWCWDSADPYPLTPGEDPDGDGIVSDCDNCPDYASLNQDDTDGDGAGDECDNCPGIVNPDQADPDGDGLGIVCDNCPYNNNPTQEDADGDGLGDACDLCDAETLPDQFDFRNYQGVNWLSSVKDQLSCGACWAFSALGAVEAIYNLENPVDFMSIALPQRDPTIILQNAVDRLDLAEQALVSDCCPWCGDCEGGQPGEVFWFTENIGVPEEPFYPYWGSNSDCDCQGCEDSNWRIDHHCRITTDDIESIKAILVCQGPLSACGGGHCIVIAGWDDADGTWIIKNSWGTSWGAQSGAAPIGGSGGGYGKIPYGHAWTGTIRFPSGVHYWSLWD